MPYYSRFCVNLFQEHNEVKSIRDQMLRLIRNQLDQTMYLQEVLADGACMLRAFVRS